MHHIAKILLASLACFSWGAPQPGPPVAFSSAGCLSCHEISAALSHPMGQVTSRSSERAAEEAGLPLEGGGLVGCATCHDERALSLDHGSFTGDAGLLRLPAERLCGTCHQGAGASGSVLAHGLFSGRAHYGGLGGLAGRADVGSDIGLDTGFDAETRSCLGCHDGSVAGVASVAADSAVQPAAGGRRSTVEAEHPIGVRYDGLGVRSLRARSALRSAASLPAEFRLAEGRLGCGSCHSVYSASPGMLVRSTRHGGLCLGCHIK